MKENKRYKNKLVLSVYLLVRIIMLFTAVYFAIIGRYFNAMQGGLALVLFFLPAILDKKLNIGLPGLLEISIILFIFCSIFLGEINNYYKTVPLWDKILHTLSGFLSAAIGLSLVDILNRRSRIKFMLSPVFAGVFAFCFSVTIGVLWEFFEYGSDLLFHTDMQKDSFVTHFYSASFPSLGIIRIDEVMINGIEFPAYLDIGLTDTMNDLIVSSAGAFVFTVFGIIYLSSHGNRLGWIKHLMLKKHPDADRRKNFSSGNKNKKGNP